MFKGVHARVCECVCREFFFIPLTPIFNKAHYNISQEP